MSSAPSHASHQRMSLTQSSAPSSSFTTPSQPFGHPSRAFRPFPSAHLDVTYATNPCLHQPYFLVNSARIPVRNPYLKGATEHGQHTNTSQPTVTPTPMHHHAATNPQFQRVPLRQLVVTRGQILSLSNPTSQFHPISNQQGPTTLKTPPHSIDSLLELFPSQHDPNEYKPLILYGPLSSSSSDSEDPGPMNDVQASPLAKEKPTSPSVTTFTTAANMIDKSTSSTREERNDRPESFVASRSTSPKKPPPRTTRPYFYF
jgi:hypothetical protein